MVQITDDALLFKVKNSLALNGVDDFDEEIKDHINTIKEFMRNAGVQDNFINDTSSVGAIQRGVWELMNHYDNFTSVFINQVKQLSLKRGE